MPAHPNARRLIALLLARGEIGDAAPERADDAQEAGAAPDADGPARFERGDAVEHAA